MGHKVFRYFKDFNFDALKIDGQFIRNIAHYLNNPAIKQALVTISQQFDMFTVAKDIETPTEAAWLQVRWVDCPQEFHFDTPSLVPPWQTHAAQTC